MAPSQFVLIANRYDTEADARADFNDVRRIYAELGASEALDAAVITRRPGGKVEIVKTTDRKPTGAELQA